MNPEILNALERRRLLPFCLERSGTGPRMFTWSDALDGCRAVSSLLRPLAPGSPVGILGGRSFHTYVAVLGAFLSGHPFLCLGPTWPEERRRRALEAIGAAMILDTRSGGGLSARGVAAHGGFRSRRIESELAYFVATSGSTGVPKLIPISVGNLEAYLEASIEHRLLREGMRVSQAFEPTFDPAIGELFHAVLAGCCLCPHPAGSLPDLRTYLETAAVSWWGSSPALFAQASALGQFEGWCEPAVEFASFIGEELTAPVALEAARVFPHARIFNQYGPAECTVAVTLHEWQRDFAERERAVPIGKPFGGVDILLRAGPARLATPAPGNRGELLVAGAQVFAGYLPAEGEPPAPFVYDHGRTYFATRDLVHVNAGGNLVFDGREDLAFKVAGNRIDPRDVEGVFLEARGVRGAVHAPGGTASVLYLEGAPDAGDVRAAMTRCRDLLPSYQLPRAVFLLARFPLGANGKVDRHALTEMQVCGALAESLILPG